MHKQILVITCVAGFCSRCGTAILFPVLPYYAQEMGATPATVGLIMASFAGAAAVVMIPAGTLSDRMGYHRLLVFGIAFSVLSPLICLLATSPAHLGLALVLQGISWAMIFPTTSALATCSASGQRTGEALGWQTMANQLGFAIGPIMGGLLLNYCGFAVVFYVSAAISLFGFAFVFLRLNTIRLNGGVKNEKNISWGWLKTGGVIAGLSAIFFLGVNQHAVTTFVPLYVEGFGMGEAQAGIILAVLFAGSTVARIPGGRLSDKVGRKPVVSLGLFLGIISTVLLSFTDSLFGLVTEAFFCGVGMGLVVVAGYALVADQGPPGARGLIMGINSTCAHVSMAIGAVSMGMVAEVTGYDVMFRVCAIISLLGLLIFLGLSRRCDVVRQ
jgi:MFS family permease